MKRIILIIAAFFLMISVVRAEDKEFRKLADNTVSFFKPMTAEVTAVEGGKIKLSVGERDGVRRGMRMKVMREGAPFIHPVTRELLGRVESVIGRIEITDVGAETSTASMVEGSAEKGDKARISDTKVRLTFCQDKSIDWYLAEEYYRTLKNTGKLEISDSGLETDDEAKVISEAKSLLSEVALLITAKEVNNVTTVRERLYWVSNGSKFFDSEITVDKEIMKDLKFGSELFSPPAGEAVLSYDLPFGARLVASGDIYGDGKTEILLSSGREVRIYMTAVDLQPLTDIRRTASAEIIWLDTIDLNHNGRDEVILTEMRNDEVVSSIYEYADNRFDLLWEGKYFIRKSGTGLIVQSYSSDEGFVGDVQELLWNGKYTPGEKLTLPKNVNIYDFVYIDSGPGERFVLTYNEKGFLDLYDNRGIRLWTSASNNGGFLNTYKKRASVTYLEPGVWSVKDRLVRTGRAVMAVERVPLAEQAKGIGFKSSRLKKFSWNGFSMDEGVIIDGIKGTLLDYTVAGDKLAVLTSPFLGIKFSNILRGENPLGSMLYIYSVKGR